MLLFSRVPSAAALEGLRGFWPEPNLHGLPVGAARAATANYGYDAGSRLS
ncbi:hypothetical protein LC55x_0166 [Lysobacter capsici]|nr:hypothetical protein LC55x_0166 [Lysobacter capsici]